MLQLLLTLFVVSEISIAVIGFKCFENADQCDKRIVTDMIKEILNEQGLENKLSDRVTDLDKIIKQQDNTIKKLTVDLLQKSETIQDLTRKIDKIESKFDINDVQAANITIGTDYQRKSQKL